MCEDANLCGDITIATGCVIHPSATIIAESGPIIFGENCIIEESSTIIHRVPKNQNIDNEMAAAKPILRIGANNVFEVGCRVEALEIGDKNTFECKSYVSSDVKISNGCIIGAGCRVDGKFDLPENTVIYGRDCSQREALEKQGVSLIHYFCKHIILTFIYNFSHKMH